MLSTTCLIVVALAAAGQTPYDGPTLEERLKAEKPAVLAADARRLGDPKRGAILFHQAHVTCSRCHVGEGGKAPLGPDIASIDKSVVDAYLIESVLYPSKEIKKGFATLKVATKDGRTVSGILAEETADRLVLRDLLADGKLVSLSKSEIEERSDNGPSSMPTGLVNGLRGRGQFLDLIAYLRAAADGGRKRVDELKPAPSLLAPPPLPPYEKDLDHAGMIADLGEENLKRGEAIYLRVCANCHGTRTQEGSMPTSLKFWSGKFKRGSDPHAMYQTLTMGQDQMPAQPWMVPQQKYDVIHYVRETLIEPYNQAAYQKPSRQYLSALPKGRQRGPQPNLVEPWSKMDYGPFLMTTIEVGNDAHNFAYKGIAVRLDAGPGGISQGKVWSLFDHDTMRIAAFWTGKEFIDWNGIGFNGRHQIHPRVEGIVRFETPAGPGWADPETGSLADPRLVGRDGRKYGPMPRGWLKYKGLYRNGDHVTISYSVGGVDVLDATSLAADGEFPVLARDLEIKPNAKPLTLVVADDKAEAAIAGDDASLKLETKDGRILLRIPSSAATRSIRVLVGSRAEAVAKAKQASAAVTPLSERIKPGPSQWPTLMETSIAAEPDDGPFAVDVLTHPKQTPWHSQMRFGGHDFTADGKSLIVCDWDGDVWRVDGLDRTDGKLVWKRIASGLFQPLGVKVQGQKTYITCRDQIVILEDLNGDGETDFYRCFNDDHQVTDHFHEFAMDLQTDAEGNFYYTKAGRHALKALVPQHGTLLRVSKDGSKTEILATGFRAPNGVAVNPDGTYYVTDQEGFWLPKNRVNLVRQGGFYGNIWGYTDVVDTSDSAMEPPICWITNAFDRSPSQVLKVEGERWAPLTNRQITLSYGYGKIFLLLEQKLGTLSQGGLVQLPITRVPTGLIRGRFRPEDGHLYACGMFAWAGDQQQPGGLYRVRRTGKPLHVPIDLQAAGTTLTLKYAEPLDPKSVEAQNVEVRSWMLKRSANYGSNHIGEKTLRIQSVQLSGDGKTVTITTPELQPTMGMEIKLNLKAKDGSPASSVIHNTIHRL